MQGATHPLNNYDGINKYEAIEDAIIYDDIIKEELVSHDPNQIYASRSTEDTRNIDEQSNCTLKVKSTVVNESELEDSNICQMCGCEAGSIGLLKWHMQERHSQNRQLNEQNSKLKHLEQLLHPNTIDCKHPSLKEKRTKYEKSSEKKKKNKKWVGKILAKEKASKMEKNTLKKTDAEKIHMEREILRNCRTEKKNYAEKEPSKPPPKAPLMGILRKKLKESGTEQKVSQCKHCLRKFYTSQRLRNHMRIHNNQQPYQCSDC